MVPMKNEKAGYIVVAAEPHAFDAKITSTVVKNAVYLVEVKFGNKKSNTIRWMVSKILFVLLMGL